jgi:hypothetical protein
MFRTLAQGVGLALSLATLLGTASAELEIPAWCWPYCAYEQECQNWFGTDYYYCGYNAGWVYCCSG